MNDKADPASERESALNEENLDSLVLASATTSARNAHAGDREEAGGAG